MDEFAACGVVREAMRAYGLDGVTLHFVKYRENYVYRAERGGDTYAVRLHRRGVHSTAAVKTELDYLVGLRQRGFPVPEPIRTVAGDLVCLVGDAHHAPHQVDVQRWIDGASPMGDISEAFDGASTLGPGDFHVLGQLAAELHNRTQELGRVPGFARQAWDVDGLVGGKALWGDPLELDVISPEDRRVLDAAIVRLTSELAALGTGPQVYGVIHADFTPENILVRGDELSLIDFDDCGEGWHLFELATAVFFFLPHPQFHLYSRALIAGYRTRRPLGEDQLGLWAGMLLARGLTYLGWASTRRGNETAEFIARHVTPVVTALARDFLCEQVAPT